MILLKSNVFQNQHQYEISICFPQHIRVLIFSYQDFCHRNEFNSLFLEKSEFQNSNVGAGSEISSTLDK